MNRHAPLLRRAAVPAAVCGSFLFCSLRIFLLVNRYSVNVLVGDQWVYDQPTLFHRTSLWAIFRYESNPWREGLGGLLQVWIEPAFNWSSRAESFFAAGLVMICCALALFLKRRFSGKFEFWDAIIPIAMLTPACYETFVGVVHFSHGPLPLLLLLAIALSWTIQNLHLRYSLVAVFTALSICTGFGFFSGIVVPVILLAELRSRDARAIRLVALAIIAATWCLFFYNYSLANTGCPADATISTRNPLYYVLYVAFMFANAVGVSAQFHMLSAMLVGSTLLVGIGYVLSRSFMKVVPILLISFSLTFACASALGRMCLGLGVALGSRYVIYLLPAFLGCYLLLGGSEFSHQRRRLRLLLLVVALAIGIPHGHDAEYMSALSHHRREWASCYLQTRDLQSCNAVTGATRLTFPSDIKPQLDFLEAHRLNLFSESLPVSAARSARR